MLRYKLIGFVLLGLLLFYQIQAQEQEKIDIEQAYKKGVQYYKYNSYYDALREFQKILKFQDSPYYNDTLFMLSKVYLKIGKRTGIKKYLWSSLYYLNIYASRTKKYNWKYYMLKGNIYEALGFFERAISVYRIASGYIKDDNQIAQTIIALLRASVGYGKMDYITRYMIEAGTQILKEEQKKELEFIKGMVEFANRNYEKAFKHFLNTYREFEVYLVDNPQYYYIVAETAYRLGKYDFARKLFRRISSIVKDAEIIRKSILRIGDIGLSIGDLTVAITNYYTVAHKYPSSKEGIIAKLKLIGLMEKDIKIKARILSFAKEEFEEPVKFVAENLVKHRTDYVGKFALANLGQIVFKFDSDRLFERLEWELSLLYPPKLEYEHIEYFRFLWKDGLKKILSERVCSLYTSNPDFFKISMDKETLLKISKDLKNCRKYKERIDLLKFMLVKWDEDEIRFELAKAFYENGEYLSSIRVLETIKSKNCEYSIWLGKNFIKLKLDLKKAVSNIQKLCPVNNIDAYSIVYLYDLQNNQIKKAVNFAYKNIENLGKNYGKSETTTLFINKLFEKLDIYEDYQNLYQISKKIYEISKDFCSAGSIYIISGVRIGKTEDLKDLSEKIDDCKNSWAMVAKHLYESYVITQEVKR